MAVVYADLRFSRKAAPPQRGVAPESPCDDWEVTYENVTPLRDVQEGEEQKAAQDKSLKGSCAQHHRYLLITLCVVSLLSLIIIITLSTQLSRVTQRYDESSVALEILWQEHEHLKSGLTADILQKDSVARELQETLRRTEAELGTTKGDLWTSQEERRSTNLKLQKTLQEKVEADATISTLRSNLQNTENQLQGKSTQLSECESKSAEVKSKMNNLASSLSDTNNKLKATERNLSQKQEELRKARNSERELQRQKESLQSERAKLRELEAKLRELEAKLREAKDFINNSCHDEEDYEEDSDRFCPEGWKQIDQTCYYFSTSTNTRIKADQDCNQKESTLAKIQEGDSALQEMIAKDKRSFWIGLSKGTDTDMWKWSDGSVQQGFQSQHSACAKASPVLQGIYCGNSLPWICQRNAMKCRMTPENLRSFFEMIGVFGEKIKTKANSNSNQKEQRSKYRNSQS